MPAKAAVTRLGMDEAKTSVTIGLATVKRPMPPDAKQKNTAPSEMYCGVFMTSDT